MLDYTFSENSNSSLNENSWCDQPTIEGMEYELNSPPDLSYLENDYSTNLNHPEDDPIELDQNPALNETFEFREPESIPERSRNENFVPKSSNSDKNVEEDDDALIEYFQKLREGRLPREDIDRFEPVDVTPNWIRANKSIGINMVHSIIFRKGTPDFDEMMKKVEAKKSSPDIEKPDSPTKINNVDNDFEDDDFENIIQKEQPIDLQKPGPSRASLNSESEKNSIKVSEIVIIDSDDEELPITSTSEKFPSDVEMQTADSENDGFDSDDSLEKLFTDPTVYPTPKNSGAKISNLPTPKSPTQINLKSAQPTHISQKNSPLPTCNKNDFTLDFSDDDFDAPETSHQNNPNLGKEQNDDLENFDDIESDGAASPIIGSSHPRIFPQPSFRDNPKNSDDEFDEDLPSDTVLNTGIVDPNLSDLQIEAGSADITMEDPIEKSSTEKSEISSKNSGFLDQSAKCEESNDFDDDFSGDEFFNQFLT